MNDISDNIKSEHHWLRGLFMLLFVIIYEVAKAVLILIALFQFIFSIVTGSANANLLSFSSSLGRFVKQIADYLTYVSEERPFPFAQWPQPETSDPSGPDSPGQSSSQPEH